MFDEKDIEQKTCPKHDKTIGRIFDEINHIKNAQASFGTKMNEVIDFKNMIHKVVYGNGGDGLIAKVSKCFHMQNIQWVFMGGIGAGIVGIAVWAVRLLLAKAIG